jgi:hypothetical protein
VSVSLVCPPPCLHSRPVVVLHPIALEHTPDERPATAPLPVTTVVQVAASRPSPHRPVSHSFIICSHESARRQASSSSTGSSGSPLAAACASGGTGDEAAQLDMQGAQFLLAETALQRLLKETQAYLRVMHGAGGARVGSDDDDDDDGDDDDDDVECDGRLWGRSGSWRETRDTEACLEGWAHAGRSIPPKNNAHDAT